MSTDEVKARIAELKDQPARFGTRKLHRRGLVGGAGAIGAGAALGLGLGRAGAQDASPAASPAALAEPVRSVSREEYIAAVLEKYPMTDPATPGGQLIVGDSGDISTVNGILTDDYPTAYSSGLIFEYLIGTSVLDGTIVPGLADSYESLDGITYTFKLNPNAKWHDGTPLTAEDVKFSFDITLNPETNSSYTSQLQQNLDSYQVIDDHTFEVKALYPSATFFYDQIGVVVVMPKHVWESVPPANWAADPGSTGADASRVIGSGPFKFKEWVQGDHVTLVPNPDYWDTVTGKVPVVDEWIYRVLPDDAAAVQAVKTGESDVLITVPAPQTQEVEDTDGVHVNISDSFNFTYYITNLDPAKTTLFQDVAVRQALLTALDKQGIVDTVYAGFGEVANGTQAKMSWAYAPDRIRTHYDYDPDRANQLLEDAGWVDSDGDGVREKDGQKLSFKFTISEGSTGENLAAVFQENWAEIGAEMNPEIIPFTTQLEKLDAYDFEVSLLGFAWSPDPGQGIMFRCDSYGGGFNYAKYCNPHYDELDDQQVRELDHAKRLELLIELSNIANDDVPVGIFRFAVNRTAVNDRVQNFYPNAFGTFWSMPWTWLQS